MNFVFKHFNELTPAELYDILQLRAERFVVEQTCIYNDGKCQKVYSAKLESRYH